MVISENEASIFIQGYTQLMVEIYGAVPPRRRQNLLNVIAAARIKYQADRSLLNGALRLLNDKSVSVPDQVVSAVRRLEVKKWVYLRDTNAYSIFIDPSGEVAYGVLGLTDRIKTIIGGSGAVVEMGLVRYLGHYVTDGIVSDVVWLGPNYKKDFSDRLRGLRNAGRFHSSCSSPVQGDQQAAIADPSHLSRSVKR